MGSSGGQQSSQSTSKQAMPAWETPFAKAYISSLAGLVFPGTDVPSNYYPKDFSFGQMQGNTVPSSVGSGSSTGASGSGGGQGVPQTPLNQAFMDPMIASSPYLQALFAANPQGAQGSMGGAAYQQLAQLYGGGGNT
jgi:hypothetical protein